ALARRNLVLYLMHRDHRITRAQEDAARKLPLGLHIEPQRDNLAPYYIEDIREYLEHTYGTAAVHEQGLRVYTTLNVDMQKAADQAVRDGLHEYDRRHGWRGNLPNIFTDHLGTLAKYHSDDWDGPIEDGEYVTGLVTAVKHSYADVKIGRYHAKLTPADLAWTGFKSPEEILKVGDLVNVHINAMKEDVADVQLEQIPQAQAALIAIDNATGEIKAMVGGYSFTQSKFNRATQAMRQTGSSFKVYVYSEALLQGATPFDTVMDEPVTYRVGNIDYSPHDYDDKFEGRITLRRALADSRNVPAVRLLNHVGIENVIELARKFGIVSPLPPYLPLALGAADLTLLEHTSAFTVFPDDGIHIEPYDITRVSTYDGALLEEHRPEVTDVIPPPVARTMVAMLEDVVNFGTGVRAKELARPSAGKTGTTNNFTDAWYIGFTPRLTCGVWVGNDNPAISLGDKETGARAALPIWLEFMQKSLKDKSVDQFPNVVPLEQQAPEHVEEVDTADTAPPADSAEQGFAPVSAPQGALAGAPAGAAADVTPAAGAPAQKNAPAQKQLGAQPLPKAKAKMPPAASARALPASATATH
ncbi:MAG TPA: penicillin-binding transpeptidase domain-containing protein, partial [Candidatus Dormibacteraeota bacterium]|nr:penicillin-binding transpeptidase domain-containing protein [Candidatus Dormibacteraeota bacterium]